MKYKRKFIVTALNNRGETILTTGRYINIQKIYFSDASKTIDAWTGGENYKWIWSIKIFGYKIEIWKHYEK